jgi:hypothetical protein
MKANPGGQLAVEEILGRDTLVSEMWHILEGRSIYMNDLRRVGKTMILRKMDAKPPKGWLTVKRDLGGCHTAAEFATVAFRDSEAALGTRKRALRRMGQMLGLLKGAEIAGVLKLPDGAEAPWKEVLTRTFSDLEEELIELNGHMVFLWDEVPFLLDNVSKREGPNRAMEILDVLRSLSQDYSRVRLVMTGSVGLHHVLTGLRKRGYLNSPLNHMERVAPGPLAAADARDLALRLLKSAELNCVDPKACAQAIADSVGNVAFYIHKLISRLPKNSAVDPDLVEKTLMREIADADNDWDLPHYRTRVPLYYGKKSEGLVLGILDAIAAAAAPISFQAIRKELSARISFDDEERLREMLKLLQQDHYLSRDEKGEYAFRFSLIRRWWRFDRNL